MGSISVVVVVVVAIFAASILGAWLRGGATAKGDSGELRAEMQRLLTAQAQGFSAQMGQVTQLVTQELSEVRRELEMGVTNTGRISVDAQKEVSEQLRSSNDAMTRLTQHLEKVQESGRELSEAAQTMQTVMGGPKSRGVVGEAQLDALLSDVLPKASYETDHRFSNDETVSAALHAGGKWIAIDASFPLSAYRKVVQKGEKSRPEFAAAVREKVDEIADKYILQGEETPNLALMFVPSEGAFYELLTTGDDDGMLDDYCRGKHVLPVSPNGLHAYLSAVLVALKGGESEENARRMLGRLNGVKRTFEEFAEAHSQLGQQLQNFRQSYEEATRQLENTISMVNDTVADAGVQAESSPEQNPAEDGQAVVATATSNNGAA